MTLSRNQVIFYNMDTFKINFNYSDTPAKSQCLFITDMTLPELSPLYRQGIKCMSFVHWFGPWMIERNGTSQIRHLDFYWIFGEGKTIETADGVTVCHAGDFLVVPSWIDRRQKIIGNKCPHIYARTDEPDKFPQFQQVIKRKSILTDDFRNDVIRLAKSCNPLMPDDSHYRKPLAELVALEFAREVGSQDDPEKYFRQKLFHCLNQDHSENLSVQELADRMCMSESGLYKKCMELLDTSPGQILSEHRLYNSRQYLLSGSYTLRNVAKIAGYANEFSFSKAFRKRFGMPPSEYRKSMLNGATEKDPQ